MMWGAAYGVVAWKGLRGQKAVNAVFGVVYTGDVISNTALGLYQPTQWSTKDLLVDVVDKYVQAQGTGECSTVYWTRPRPGRRGDFPYRPTPLAGEGLRRRDSTSGEKSGDPHDYLRQRRTRADGAAYRNRQSPHPRSPILAGSTGFGYRGRPSAACPCVVASTLSSGPKRGGNSRMAYKVAGAGRAASFGTSCRY